MRKPIPWLPQEPKERWLLTGIFAALVVVLGLLLLAMKAYV
jgi:hypothetical protein